MFPQYWAGMILFQWFSLIFMLFRIFVLFMLFVLFKLLELALPWGCTPDSFAVLVNRLTKSLSSENTEYEVEHHPLLRFMLEDTRWIATGFRVVRVSRLALRDHLASAHSTRFVGS